MILASQIHIIHKVQEDIGLNYFSIILVASPSPGASRPSSGSFAFSQHRRKREKTVESISQEILGTRPRRARCRFIHVALARMIPMASLKFKGSGLCSPTKERFGTELGGRQRSPPTGSLHRAPPGFLKASMLSFLLVRFPLTIPGFGGVWVFLL